MKSAKSIPGFVSGVLVTLACLSATPVSAADNVWTSLGPTGVPDITSVVLDPADPRILYATSATGAPGTSGIRKSLDGGTTWATLGPSDPDLSTLTRLAVDPSDSSTLFVGSPLGLVAVSHDAGATWIKTTISTTPVSALAFEVSSGNVYAATRPVGNYDIDVSYGPAVMRSGDAGATWQETNLARPRGVYALLADALDGSLLAATDFAYSNGYYGGQNPEGGGVSKSSDAGATWTLPASDLGYSVTALTRPRDGNGVFAATSSGQILASPDDGANWTPRGQLPGGVSSLAVDPTSSTTLYAGLFHGGVWRSFDGGANWHSISSGLTGTSVRSLAIDPTGRNLYAGTDAGVFQRGFLPVVTAPCHAGGEHLCLLGSRFRVDLFAVDPATQAPAVVRALPKGDRFGYFSFPSLTGDAALPEVFVKMLDATALPGQGYWLFSTSLTNVVYSLVVTDTASGRVALYDSQAFCGNADVHAFPQEEPPPHSLTVRREKHSLVVPRSELALLSGRFRLTLSATDPRTGESVAGAAIPQDDRFGYFSLPALTGDETFPEVFVKMLDATSLPDADFWLFQSGLTNLPYTLTVTDSATGASKTYRNDPSDPTRLCGNADLRVTKGPAPILLTGDWNGEYGSGSIDSIAEVIQSGTHLSFRESYWNVRSFEGTLAGSLNGVLRIQYRACQFEGPASGHATETEIELNSDDLSGTCGTWVYGGFVHLIPPGGAAGAGTRR
jgi:hypothetical protein